MSSSPLPSASPQSSAHAATGKTTKMPFRFNPFHPDFCINPYPTYRRLREEAPLYQTPCFIGREWFLTRFSDVRSVLSDGRFQIDALPQRIQKKGAYLDQSCNLDALTQTISQWLFFLNPPDHTKLRGLVSHAFSAGSIAQMQTFVQTTLEKLMAPIQTGQVIDVMPTLAYPLPALLTAHILGVPLEDCDHLTHWSRKLFWVFDQPMSLEGYTQLNQVALEFTAYFQDLLEQRQKKPQADLLSYLANAQYTDAKLTQADILSFCAMVFSVGQETTGSAIGSSLLALLQHPEQWALLRQNPTLLKGAVEELLRYESPTQILVRVAVEDVALDGHIIQAGDRVVACLGAANRDPAQFPNPDNLDLTRSMKPNLAFGSGIHHCLGGPLARMMCQLTLQTLDRQFTSLQLACETPEWRQNFIVRGLKTLPIEFKR